MGNNFYLAFNAKHLEFLKSEGVLISYRIYCLEQSTSILSKAL